MQYNVQDIKKIDDLRKENNLGQLRLNIFQIWDDTKMSDDIKHQVIQKKI